MSLTWISLLLADEAGEAVGGIWRKATAERGWQKA
jgi:hypothetical protein